MDWYEERKKASAKRRSEAAKETQAKISKARASAVDVPPTLYQACTDKPTPAIIHVVVKIGGGWRITRCGKAMYFPDSVNRPTEESEECRRCGTHAEFLAVAEEEQQRREQAHIARKQQDAQREIEAKKSYEEESAALDSLMAEVRSISHLPPKKGRANYRQALQFTFNGRSYVITEGELDKE